MNQGQSTESRADTLSDQATKKAMGSCDIWAESEQEGSGHKDTSGKKETIEEYVPDKGNDFYFLVKRIYLWVWGSVVEHLP